MRIVTVGKRNCALNVKDRAFAVCQQFSVSFCAVGFAITSVRSSTACRVDSLTNSKMSASDTLHVQNGKERICCPAPCTSVRQWLMDPRGTNCFSAIAEDEKRLVATTSTRCLRRYRANMPRSGAATH